MIYLTIVAKESPKWLYIWKRYPESKDSLEYVAKFNGVDEEFIKDYIVNKDFDKEIKDEDDRISGRDGPEYGFEMP